MPSHADRWQSVFTATVRLAVSAFRLRRLRAIVSCLIPAQQPNGRGTLSGTSRSALTDGTGRGRCTPSRTTPDDPLRVSRTASEQGNMDTRFTDLAQTLHEVASLGSHPVGEDGTDGIHHPQRRLLLSRGELGHASVRPVRPRPQHRRRLSPQHQKSRDSRIARPFADDRVRERFGRESCEPAAPERFRSSRADNWATDIFIRPAGTVLLDLLFLFITPLYPYPLTHSSMPLP